jgi:murein L,D-transpeptidase YcbB/YkuD
LETLGLKLRKLLKHFNLKNGLTADGIVGDGTWKKIMGEAAQAAPTPTPIVSAPIVNQ